MAKRNPEPKFPERDGTSQQARRLTALDPDHVLVDERSPEDLLAFARHYGSELKYFGPDNVEAGDWSGFVDPRLSLEEVAAFMEHPERFSPDRSPLLFRPHFVLFLTFLRLLRGAQRELNTFGRRHLDFYFREFLRLSGKPARPDRVNVLLDLAPGIERALIPEGSLLTAGPDSSGKDRLYATDREVVISRAQVERLSSVHVAWRITGLPEARARHKNDHESAALAMLEIALGHPEPGAPLPDYPGQGPLDLELLVELEDLVAFAETDLHLRFFELRELMRLLEQRRSQDDQNWTDINTLIESAGRSRDSRFRLDRASRDFEANLEAAAGGKPPYSRLPEIDDVYDLYDLRTRQDAREFIEEQLSFTFDNFVEMMQIKVRLDREWDQINLLLEKAGQGRRGGRGFQLPVTDPADFSANLASALGELSYPALAGAASLDGYYEAVRRAAAYFFVEPELLAYLLPRLVAKPPPNYQWRKVDEILVTAHREKSYSERRLRLREIHEDLGFTAMIRYALGEEQGTSEDASALDRLEPFLSGAENLALLERLAREPESAVGDDWPRAYELVEIAQRNREGRGEPIPRKEEWLNVHPAPDATAVTAGAPDGADEVTEWQTFGAPAPHIEGDPPAPVLGWACSSPLLALAAGERTIELTLGFEPHGFDGAQLEALLAGDLLRVDSPLRIQVTTEEQWVEPDSVKVTVGSYAALTAGRRQSSGEESDALHLALSFSEGVDALAAAPLDVTGLESQWPALRLMLGQVWQAKLESYVTPYPELRSLHLATVHVRVSVKGLEPSHLQNDETTLDPKKPFEPFGSTPAAGAQLLIGHPELAAKRLTRVGYQVEWMGLPESLADHYEAYKVDGKFTVALGLMDRRVKRQLNASAELFEKRALAIEDLPSAMAPRTYGRLASAPTSPDLRAWDRYLLWELNRPDFQHQTYPTVASSRAIELAAAIANDETIKPEKYQVNPPYTPKIKSLRIDYVSEVELDPARPSNPSDRILHVHPFGTCGVSAERTPDGIPFMPRYENEGELYIGLRDANPPQTVSFLVQMAEGSADPDLEPEPVAWSFLNGDRWIPLSDRKILLDTTRGFRNSGVVELALEGASASRRLSGNLYWLRASVGRGSAGLCNTVAIQAQAVAATFVDHDNAPDHFAQPLPPDSIAKFVEANPQVVAVRQPYTSAGGRTAEAQGAFDTRVSERLRHKQRAVTLWDYERLVLERFPQIYKAKCIPASSANTVAGQVQIVVVPDVRDKLPFDPFGPRAPADLLAEIKEYLDARTPSTATVKVSNPHYVAVKVGLFVRFRAGGNVDYFKQLLADELNRFLSPWAYEEGAEIVISGRIHANSIVNFLDRRPYVDYIADIRLFTSDDGEDFRLVAAQKGKSYFVSAGRADGVLVAARQHEIDLIPEAGFELDRLTGINFMKVDLDLRVAEDPTPS